MNLKTAMLRHIVFRVDVCSITYIEDNLNVEEKVKPFL